MTGTVTVNDITISADRISSAEGQEAEFWGRGNGWQVKVWLDDGSTLHVRCRDQCAAEQTATLLEAAPSTMIGEDVRWLIVDIGAIESIRFDNDDGPQSWPEMVLMSKGVERRHTMPDGAAQALTTRVAVQRDADDAPVWMVQVMP
jgi:hypothetical protein